LNYVHSNPTAMSDDRALQRRSVLVALSAVVAGCSALPGETDPATRTETEQPSTDPPAPDAGTPTAGGGSADDAEPATDTPASRSDGPDDYDVDVPYRTESVWVETGTDTDDTGRTDRVEVYVVRPESATSPLPAVVRADPYDVASSPKDSLDTEGVSPPDGPTDLYGARDVPLFVPDSGTPAGRVGRTGSTERRFAAVGPVEAVRRAYVRLFVPEGYAYVDVSPVGTGRSTGCNTLGGEPEARSVVAAIDWLNGRVPAYAGRASDDTVGAEWASGDAGMVGQSYLGSIQNNVVVTGVDGLKTVVPKASMVSRYVANRSHGAVTTDTPTTSFAAKWTTGVNRQRCDDVLERMAAGVDWRSGNFNDYWADREYVAEFDDVDASVLLVHTLRDDTMSPRQLSVYAEALRRHDVPHRMWVGQGDHGAVPNLRNAYEDRYRELLLDWFDYWVGGEPTGVMDGPTAVVETPGGELAGESAWPSPRSERVPFRARPGDPFGALEPDAPAPGTTDRFVDDSDVLASELTGEEATANRVVYRTDPLDGPVRVSGTVTPDLTVSVDSEAALLSIALVDYGPNGDRRIVSRGWMNLLNRTSRSESEPLVPGERYDVSFEPNPTEHVFPEGHRLGVMVYSSDPAVTKRPPSSPTLTLHLADTAFSVPVVGGRDAVTDPAPSRDPLYGDPPFE
jgi:X-Pro dipeptidyl-peptidase